MDKLTKWFPVEVEYECRGKIQTYIETVSISCGFAVDDFIDRLNEIKENHSKLSKIFRVEPATRYSYDDEWVEWVVECYREETDEEYNVRKKEQKDREDAQHDRETAEFLRLKEKFDKGLLM